MSRMRKIKNADILILKYASLITTPQATYFKNKNPLEIEIGSGKGMFLISKAFTYPEINFIGVERDATIVLKALRKIEQLTTKPSNLLFINDQAANLHKWFRPNSTNVIYLNFPDPWPKRRHEKNRLTHVAFLNLYYEMLKINGEVQLKTDNLPLFHYSLSSFQTFGKFKEKIVIFNLYCHPSMLSDNIKSEYETKFVAQDIKIKKLGFIKT